MKIGVAQTKPIKGDIDGNIAGHKRLIELAVSNQADAIIFPELSLTGYEPTLADSLAIYPQDIRLDVFQAICDDKKLMIGVSVPTRNKDGICISLIIFQPLQERCVYSKKYIHPDEEEFFVRGQNIPVLKVGKINMALAICYELSVPEHAKTAFDYHPQVYIASVAKFVHGIDAAMKRLSIIAKEYSTLVLMANCIGESDGFECAGKTASWNKQGELIAQLNDHQEGIIIVDTGTQAVIEHTIK